MSFREAVETYLQLPDEFHPLTRLHYFVFETFPEVMTVVTNAAHSPFYVHTTVAFVSRWTFPSIVSIRNIMGGIYFLLREDSVFQPRLEMYKGWLVVLLADT